MKKILFTALSLTTILLVSCNSTKKEEVKMEVLTPSTPADVQIEDSHNAENSLDIVGIYNGVLPCADCEGIQTKVELNADKTYTVTTLYLTNKEGNKEFVEQGKWEIKVNTIVLQNDVKDGQPHTRFFVGEHTLTQLDLDGNKVQGALAQNYVLTKQ